MGGTDDGGTTRGLLGLISQIFSRRRRRAPSNCLFEYVLIRVTEARRG